MTSGLRTAHKIIWILSIIIIPVLIFLSIQSIKEPFLTDSDTITTSKLSGELMVLENESFLIRIKKQKTHNTLRIILKKPLRSASSIVYGTKSDREGGIYIGTLENKGIYTFEVDKSTKGIRIYDAIKKNDILNIEL